MSPEQRRVIRSLIQEQRIEEARNLLLTMDDPVVEKWLPQVIEPEPQPQTVHHLYKIFYVLTLIGVFSIGIIVGAVWFRSRSLPANTSTNVAAVATEPSITETALSAVLLPSATPLPPTMTVTAMPTVDTASTQQASATTIAQLMQTATQLMESQTITLTRVATGLTPTPIPLKDCKVDAVQMWSETVSTQIHIPMLIGEIQLKPADEVVEELKNSVMVDQDAIALVPFAECLTVARKLLLEAHSEMLNGLKAYLDGYTALSNTHIDKSLDDLQQYGEELQYALDHFAEP